MPPVSTLTLRHEQVNCSAGALPIQWVMPVRLPAWNERDGRRPPTKRSPSGEIRFRARTRFVRTDLAVPKNVIAISLSYTSSDLTSVHEEI